MKPNQRGRFNRHNNNNNNGGMPRSTGGRPQTIFRNTSLESTGPCGKLRGTALQLHEKYLMAGKDALIQNDDVLAETCFQYADHYMHVQNEAIANEQALHAQQQAAREAAAAEAAAAETAPTEGIPLMAGAVKTEEPKVVDVSVPVAQMNTPAEPVAPATPAPETAPKQSSAEPKRRVLRPKMSRKDEGMIPLRPMHTTI